MRWVRPRAGKPPISFRITRAAPLLFHTTTSFLTWVWDADLRSGDMSFKLLKPMDPFHQYLTQEIGLRVVVLAFLLPALIALAFLLPDLTYRLAPLGWLAAVAAALAGFFLNVMMAMAFATIGFWTTQAGNIYSLWWGVGAFLSGWIAPLALLPEVVADAARFLPFRSSMGFPLEIMLDRLTAARESSRVLRWPWCGSRSSPSSIGWVGGGDSPISGGGRMNRYLRLLKIFWGNALSTELEYRAAFLGQRPAQPLLVGLGWSRGSGLFSIR